MSRTGYLLAPLAVLVVGVVWFVGARSRPGGAGGADRTGPPSASEPVVLHGRASGEGREARAEVEAIEGGSAEIVGRVVDGGGEPTLEATFELAELDGTSIDSVQTSSVEAGAEFRCVVAPDKIEGRRCGLFVRAPGYVARWIPLTTVRAGTRLRVGDIRLEEKALTIEGKVVPVPDRRLDIQAQPESPWPDAHDVGPEAPIERVEASETGTFRIDGLRRGAYRLTLSFNGRWMVVEHVEAGSHDVVVRVDPGWLKGPRPTHDLLVRLPAVSPDEEPSVLQQPPFQRPPGQWPGYTNRYVERREDAWLIRGVESEGLLLVRAHGFAPAVLSPASRVPGPIDVHLTPGLVLEGHILVEGAPARAVATLDYYVGPSGRALWPGDGPNPVPPRDALRVFRELMSMWDQAEDDLGRFHFWDLPPGEGWLSAFVAATDDRPGFPLPGRKVTFGSGQHLVVSADVPPTLRLEVVLVGTPSGSSGSEATVTLWRGHTQTRYAEARAPARFVRLEDGAPVFRAENLLEGARHDVFASLINGGRSYHGRIRGVRIRPSEPRLVVTMHETAPLRGRVVDARGSVSPGAKVSVQPAVQEYTAWSEEPWKPWVVRADAEGRFSLALPPVGVVSVVATSEEGTFESPPMQAASTAQDLTLVLAPPAEASGRVVTDAGRLVPEAMRVRVVTETGEELARVDTGDDDFFIARWPHSGPVRFVVEPCDRTMSIYDWTWEIPESNVCHVSRPISDPRSDLRLKLEPGVIRTGIVCDTDGTPLPEILISVRGRWSHRETGTDREGRWRIAGLCDAEVEVTATGADGQQAHARTAGDTDLRMVLPTR